DVAGVARIKGDAVGAIQPSRGSRLGDALQVFTDTKHMHAATIVWIHESDGLSCLDRDAILREGRDPHVHLRLVAGRAAAGGGQGKDECGKREDAPGTRWRWKTEHGALLLSGCGRDAQQRAIAFADPDRASP